MRDKPLILVADDNPTNRDIFTARLTTQGYDVINAVNPRLVYCSITGYGEDGRSSERPAYDALVAARTGQMHH